MKFLCNLVLILFVLFLATPTIISVIDKTVDTSYFFNLGEEENQSVSNEIKSIASHFSIPLLMDFEGQQKVQYSIINDRKVNSINPSVYIQPPELI